MPILMKIMIAAYSFFTVKIYDLVMGQGTDGFLIPTKYLGKIKEFYDIVCERKQIHDFLMMIFGCHFTLQNILKNLCMLHP